MKYVAGLMFTPEGDRLAMVLKNRPAWQAGLFNAIGGKIENGEDPATTMAREFEEETGVKTSSSEWEYLLRIEGEEFEVTFFTMFSDKAFEARTIETETIHLLQSQNLPPNVIPNLRWIIPLALDKNVVSPRLFKYK